jgi:hypothetical protein
MATFCTKHPHFALAPGVYFRAADKDMPAAWIPASENQRNHFYAIAVGGDPEEMADVMGAAQLYHSVGESSGSAFVSVAKCPHCLRESTDPTVQAILAAHHVWRLEINPKNQPGSPYVFDMEGDTIGGRETECLVLLPNNVTLASYIKRLWPWDDPNPRP